MNTNIREIEHKDELMERYNELAQQVEIDSVEHAKAWRDLAIECAQANRPAFAGMCIARAAFFAAQVPDAYVRLLNGPFSELVAVVE